jgi:hypothetical protein
MMLPQTPRKRRWGWLLLWTLLVFASGVAAGPALTYHSVALVERTCSMLGMSTPGFVTSFKRTAVATALPLPPGVDRSPVGEGQGTVSAAVAEPVAVPVEKPAVFENPAVAVVPQSPPPASPADEEAKDPAENVVAEKPAASPSHAKTAHAKAAPAGTHGPAREGASSDNPFEERAGRRGEPQATAAAIRKPKPSFEEPAPRPAASASRDSLDNLMADGAPDNKDKKHGSKAIDALLKDVQKSNAEPTKREAESSAPPLSQADITKVMAGVKTRAKDCAQRLGQAGVADLKIVVGKDGNVASASVGGKLANTPLAACVEKVMRASSFPRSTGLRFDYRLDVR